MDRRGKDAYFISSAVRTGWRLRRHGALFQPRDSADPEVFRGARVTGFSAKGLRMPSTAEELAAEEERGQVFPFCITISTGASSQVISWYFPP